MGSKVLSFSVFEPSWIRVFRWVSDKEAQRGFSISVSWMETPEGLFTQVIRVFVDRWWSFKKERIEKLVGVVDVERRSKTPTFYKLLSVTILSVYVSSINQVWSWVWNLWRFLRKSSKSVTSPLTPTQGGRWGGNRLHIVETPKLPNRFWGSLPRIWVFRSHPNTIKRLERTVIDQILGPNPLVVFRKQTTVLYLTSPWLRRCCCELGQMM